MIELIGGVFLRLRMVGVYFAIVMLMAVGIFRVYYINASPYIKAAASGQGGYRLRVASTRGVIYDRNMNSLVNNGAGYVASVLPSPSAAAELLKITPEDERGAVVELLSGALPFALEVGDNGIYAPGIDVFRIPKRYGGYAYAPHVIGYLGGGGTGGAAGIELAYDRELSSYGGDVSCLYHMDAAGQIMDGEAMSIDRENEAPTGGVSLALDRDIQHIAQEALKSGCEMGAAIVMEPGSGDILAMASLPEFDQDDIGSSLAATHSPFISRATSGYNIGSVFKLLVSAAALEKGIPKSREYTCAGAIDIGGVIFKCNNNAVHGVCDMQRALNVSCNAYFINLAREDLGGAYLLQFCHNIGLGSSAELAPGMRTQAGNLPEQDELENPAALANFSFGQGSSLATPLQIASVVSSFVNSGKEALPKLVRGLTDDGLTLSRPRPQFAENRLMRESTANTMISLMTGVVDEGSGRTAKPARGGAGGKTSSAQTGISVGGKEIVHAWFAGFYPAENPKYSIVVFVEGGESGEQKAAPIFKEICDGIDTLEPVNSNPNL